MACERITKGITAAFSDKRPIKAVLDPYNPVGSTAHVRFNTSRTERWDTSGRRPNATSTGWCLTATGKANSAVWRSRIRACALT